MRNIWPSRFLALAIHVSSWSKDPSTQVGAVIFDAKRRVRGLGYNGFPRGVADTTERYIDRPVKYSMVVHAEANAILNAIGSVEGCFLVSTFPPCAECAKLIIQAGIKAVYHPISSVERWTASCDTALTMFLEAGVSVHEIEP